MVEGTRDEQTARASPSPARVASPYMVLFAYAAAVFALQYHFPGFPSPNERSRLYVLESIVSGRGLSIDDGLARYGDMEDKVEFSGRSYSNKPPGLVALALPWYGALWLIHGCQPPPLDRALYVARLGAVTFPTLLFLATVVRFLARSGHGQRNQAALLAALSFGTGILPYGALLMAHATTSALLGIGAMLLVETSARPTPRQMFAVALLAGLAIATDYPSAPPAAIIVLFGLLRGRSGSTLAATVVGLLPGAALAFGYNVAVFGNPLDLGYSHHVDAGFAAVHSSGLYGFHLPTIASIYGLSLAPSRGLLSWSPLFILAVPGAIRAWSDRSRRFGALTLAFAAASLFLFIAAYPNWHGGWSVGPRYLLPCMPLLFLLVCEVDPESRWWRLMPGLASYGVILHSSVAVTWPFLPDLLDNPVLDLTAPLLRAGELAPVATAFVGLPAAIGIAVVVSAISVALWAAARPAPWTALAIVAALFTVLSIRERGGPVAFCRGEVLYRRGSLPAARESYEHVLKQERPSPAMERHVRARLAAIERRYSERLPSLPAAGSNIENRRQPE